MKTINKFNSYNTNEFLPIYRDGELDNGAEFIRYKANRLAAAATKLVIRHFEQAGQ